MSTTMTGLSTHSEALLFASIVVLVIVGGACIIEWFFPPQFERMVDELEKELEQDHH